MERAGRQIVYPTIEHIVDINRQIIQFSGGTFIPPSNFQNENSLCYTLDYIQHPIVEIFPSEYSIAAFLFHRIATRHVFTDGNKRTAVASALLFLSANGMKVKLDQTVVDLALGVVTGELTQDDIEAWFLSHSP